MEVLIFTQSELVILSNIIASLKYSLDDAKVVTPILKKILAKIKKSPPTPTTN